MTLPLPTERQVQRGILTMLGTCFPKCLVHHSPNGAHLAGSAQSRFKQAGALLGDGMKRGWPDLVVLWSPHDGCFIEVKRPKLGKLSDVQISVHAKLIDLCWPVRTVDNIDDAYRFLRECGAPCSGELR